MMTTIIRWWRAGAQPPGRQIILLAELITCPSSTESKNAECKNTMSANAGPTIAESNNAECKNTMSTNASLTNAESKDAGSTHTKAKDTESQNACRMNEMHKPVPSYAMKRYRFRRTR